MSHEDVSRGVSDDENDEITSRKADHIRVCLDPSSQVSTTASFDDYRFDNEALPEMALEDVDLSTTFLGKRLSAPIIVSSMTGGPTAGATINRSLAEAVERLGLGMGVGSQRIALERLDTRSSFEVRKYAPSALVLANLGAVQLNYGYGEKQAKDAVDMIGADGLFLHLNALQEAIQEGGDTNFRALGDRIEALVAALPFPVLIKEVGAGIGARTALRLWSMGVKAIDVSGTGGTSWARVEGLRAKAEVHRTLGETFRGWGIPTPVAIERARAALPADAVLIGSGGIRTGLDAAKAIALGADVVSIAQPVLAAALVDGAAVEAVLTRFIAELRVACFAAGARTLADLRYTPLFR